MHPLIQGVVSKALEGRRFRLSLDLGCGTGDGGVLVKPHTVYLIGVDMDPLALKEAGKRGVYDELHHADIRGFPFDGADSLFLFDSLEHVSKAEGYALLEKARGRFIMLTTPWYSTPLLGNWEHKCVWTEAELRALGFRTEGYSFIPDLFMALAYGGIIVGVREP
jgi:SAM-dependent methyltransferase